MKIPDGLIKLIKSIGDDEEFIVKKTIPMTKEQIKEYKELDTLADRLQKDLNRHSSLKKLFWSKIEMGLGEYGDMRVNTETNEIEIREDDDNKKKSVKSPFVGF